MINHWWESTQVLGTPSPGPGGPETQTARETPQPTTQQFIGEGRNQSHAFINPTPQKNSKNQRAAHQLHPVGAANDSGRSFCCSNQTFNNDFKYQSFPFSLRTAEEEEVKMTDI